VHTPLFWGHDFNAGALVFAFSGFLLILTNWLIVGKLASFIKLASSN
jgi:hypothetical protein